MILCKLMELERKSQRMTFRVLKEKTGICFGRLVDIEKGRAIPTKYEKQDICKALGIYHQDH